MIKNRIVREDGLYITHIERNIDEQQRLMVICIFFIGKYVCMEWESIDEKITINNEFLTNIADWKIEINEAIQNDEINDPEARHKFSQYTTDDEGNIQAIFIDGDDKECFKKILLYSKIFNQKIHLNVDVRNMIYDVAIPSNSGFKERRLISNEPMDFYSFM